MANFIHFVRKNIRKLFSNIFWALKLIWANYPVLAWGVVAVQISQILFPGAIAFASRNLINAFADTLQIGESSQLPLFWLTVSFSLILLNSIFTYIGQYIDKRLGNELDVKVSGDILEHSARLDFAYFEDPRFQDVMVRARQGMSAHLTKFTQQIFATITGLFQLISLGVILVYIEWLIVPGLLLLFIPYFLAQWRLAFEGYQKEYDRTAKRRWTAYFISQFTNSTSIAEVQLLNLGPLLKKRFQKLMEEFRDQDRLFHQRDLRTNLVFSVLTVIFFFVILMRVGNNMLAGVSSIGDFTILLGAVATLRAIATGLVSSTSQIVAHALFVQDLRLFFQIKPKAARLTEGPLPARQSPVEKVMFDHVSFAYPGTRKLALKDVSLEINPGEIVAFVGENGSGKSTLVKLLARLYEPTKGRILVDGLDLQAINLEKYYEDISFKLQTFNKYEASAMDNIAYGNWKELLGNREGIRDVIENMEMEDFVDTLPNGYDTLLGRLFGKYDLSGGQWQKIAVARAFARKTPLLILDEPTTSLDPRAEFKLFERLRQLTENQTVILISHQFLTAQKADRIFMLHAGELVEQGTHEELMKTKGHYANLYNFSLNKEKRLGVVTE